MYSVGDGLRIYSDGPISLHSALINVSFVASPLVEAKVTSVSYFSPQPLGMTFHL